MVWKRESLLNHNLLGLRQNLLCLRQRQLQNTENEDEKNDKGEYIRRERRYGSFRRSFDVTGIDENAITASYKDGVLELTLPKAQQVLPESKKIMIE